MESHSAGELLAHSLPLGIEKLGRDTTMVKILKFATVIEANFKIAGGIIGGTPTNVPFENLVGKAITFANPAGTYTFTTGTGNLGQLYFHEVKTKLEAAIANLEVTTVNNMVGFRHKVSGQAVSMAAVDEVARQILGFANPVGGEAIAGQFLNPPDGPAPRYLEFVSEYGAIYVSVSDTTVLSQSFTTNIDAGGFALTNFDNGHSLVDLALPDNNPHSFPAITSIKGLPALQPSSFYGLVLGIRVWQQRDDTHRSGPIELEAGVSISTDVANVATYSLNQVPTSDVGKLPAVLAGATAAISDAGGVLTVSATRSPGVAGHARYYAYCIRLEKFT